VDLSSSESIFACIGAQNNDADSLLCINKVFYFLCVYQVDIESSGMAMVHAKRVGALSISKFGATCH
jgi:hypothetical protein